MIFTTAKQDYHTKVLSDMAFALTATDYKDPPTIMRGGVQDDMDSEKGGDGMTALVRRLTPL